MGYEGVWPEVSRGMAILEMISVCQTVGQSFGLHHLSRATTWKFFLVVSSWASAFHNHRQSNMEINPPPTLLTTAWLSEAILQNAYR